jgi:hypothetical protein
MMQRASLAHARLVGDGGDSMVDEFARAARSKINAVPGKGSMQVVGQVGAATRPAELPFVHWLLTTKTSRNLPI